MSVGAEEHAIGDQAVDLIGVQPQDFLADLTGVLARHRCGPQIGTRDAREQRRAGLGGHRVFEQRMNHVAEHLPVHDRGVDEHVGRAVHRCRGHLEPLQCVRDHGLVHARRPRRHHGDEIGGIVGQPGSVHRGGQRGAINGGAQRDHTPFVLARARVDGVQARIVGHGQARGPCGVGDVADGELVDGRFGLRDMNVRTGSGAVTPDQRRQRRNGGDAGDDVVGKDRGGVVEPGILLGGPLRGDAGGGPHKRPVAHLCAPRSRRTERTALGKHDAGIALAQPLVREAKRGKGSWLEIGEHRVGTGDQAGEDLRSVGAAQVQAKRILVAMRQRPGSAHHLPRRCLTKTVGIGGALDFDDLRAEVGEQPAELAASDDHAEIQDPQAVERAIGPHDLGCDRTVRSR